MKKILLMAVFLPVFLQTTYSQALSEILGRPTPSSVTVSLLSDKDMEVMWEYGTESNHFAKTTPVVSLLKNVPAEYDLTGLTGNTKYYYRLKYRVVGTTSEFITGQEHSFQTPRPKGSSFSFALEADPHLDANSLPEAYALTLQNIASSKPDFLLDLGDSFMCEKQPVKNQDVFTERHLLMRSYFDNICHSVPLYLIIGNHEGELGWSLDGTATSHPVLIANTRKLYFPNPVPNSYYSGNTIEEKYVGLRENYYSFEWGDALFVILDPYWYSVKKGDWNWTLGADQYNWFKKTLTESKARFKFVFCHNLVGGNTSDSRGGAEFAHLFEMGGYNLDGSYGFDTNRPGWQKPIHTLMVENKVTAFFHGHDHFFGKQEKDGVIYQVVPQPSNKSLTNISATEYGYVNGVFMPGRGYLNITVSGDVVKIDYIKTYLPSEENATQKNGQVAYSYQVPQTPTGLGNSILPAKSVNFGQNYPNPFSTKTSFSYSIDKTAFVELKIFDVFGKQIATLVNQERSPGTYSAVFDASRNNLPAGVYYASFTAGDFHKTISLIYSGNQL